MLPLPISQSVFVSFQKDAAIALIFLRLIAALSFFVLLQELVQNADDANARNVIFLYDKTEHPRQRLWPESLREFQGPALYAYNDATFERKDWHNIQHPEQSGKLDDLAKVGRFGLGFISVYHLTGMRLTHNTVHH